MQTYYDVLGLTPDASDDEIRRAYRELAKLFHPDRHAGAPDDVQYRSQQVMARINEAYRALADPDRRRTYDDDLAGARHRAGDAFRPGPATRRPAADECVLCACHPARQVRVEQHTGMLITRSVRRFEGRLCRDCGLELVQAMTSRTLVTGWWGIISFFANLGGLLANYNAWRRLRYLPMPVRRTDAEIIVPLPQPLAVGRPLWQRGGFLGFGAIVAMLGMGLAGGQSTNAPPSASTPTPASTSDLNQSFVDGDTFDPAPDGPSHTTPRDLEGLCLRYTYDDRIDNVVACSQPHDAKIVKVTTSESLCPRYASYFFEIPSGGRTWFLCVDR